MNSRMDVLILMGSPSDKKKMLPAKKTLDKLGISSELRITSAHRTPDRTKSFVEEAVRDGCKVFICGAGMAAHLAGVVASHTIKVVIGVPLTSDSSPLGGNDALLATVQMPPGMPVATVAIDGAKNAAVLAAQILALSDEFLTEKLVDARKNVSSKIIEDNAELQTELAQMAKEERV